MQRSSESERAKGWDRSKTAELALEGDIYESESIEVELKQRAGKVV